VDSRTAPSVHPRSLFLPYGRPHNREGLGFHVSVQQILILDDGSGDCALRFPNGDQLRVKESALVRRGPGRRLLPQVLVVMKSNTRIGVLRSCCTRTMGAAPQ
jgi:hypothetical protein